jgi:hypothetical protein
VGTVTSPAVSPRLGTIGLAILGAHAAEEGTRLGVAVGDATGAQDVFDQPAPSGVADLGRRDEAAEQLLAGLGRRVHDALQPRVDRGQQVAQPVDAARLVADEFTAARDEQSDLGVELAGRLDRSQVAAVANLVGDDCGVARVALVLAAADALAGAVDRQPGDVDDLDAGVQQHRRQQAGNAADDVDADRHGATSPQHL